MCPGARGGSWTQLPWGTLGGLARPPWKVTPWMDGAGCPLSLGEGKKVGLCETRLHSPDIAPEAPWSSCIFSQVKGGKGDDYNRN